jgi:biopolymer transport protein ExbB/TolQ
MTQLFYEGGPLFMGILTIIFIVAIAMAIYFVGKIIKGQAINDHLIRSRLSNLKSVGLFGLVVGVFGQLIGLYEAFNAIQEMGDISPGLIAGGLKVSMITTLYGIVIFLLCYLMWFGLLAVLSKSADKKNSN